MTIAATDPGAAEEGIDAGTLTVTRTGTSGDLVVSYAVGGTATAGADYGALTGTVTIADGNSWATITITPIDDAFEEGDETVTVTLAADPGYTVGSPDADTVTILDNDGNPVEAATVCVVMTGPLAGSGCGVTGADGVVALTTTSKTSVDGSGTRWTESMTERKVR